MKNLIVLFAVLTASQAWAQQLYFPNLGKNATGTTSTTHNSLDVNIVGGSFALTEEATAADGGALPALTKVISGYDGTNVQVIKTDAGGAIQVDVESSALPSGAATSAKQDILAALFPSSLGQKTMANSLACTLASDQSALAVTGTFWQATQPVSAASLPLPTGAATSAKQPALGTAGTASADVITVQGIASMTALKVDGSAVTQPISAAALPLPSGAATSAKQDTGNTSLSSIDGKITAVNTGAVVVSSSALPTGASTSALQTTGNTSLSSIDGKLGSLGQKAMAASAPVVIASDQSAVSVKPSNGATGSGSAAAATVSTVITLSKPSNAIGFVLMNLDTSTANVRWALGRTATTTLGQQLQPGRDTGFIPAAIDVSLVAESGTQNYDIQWIAQ
jgi:hypothetical protein